MWKVYHISCQSDIDPKWDEEWLISTEEAHDEYTLQAASKETSLVFSESETSTLMPTQLKTFQNKKKCNKLVLQQIGKSKGKQKKLEDICQ